MLHLNSTTLRRRYPILGEFMGYVAGGEAVNAAPAVFCAYMGVLTALATTEAGAQVCGHPISSMRSPATLAAAQPLEPFTAGVAVAWRLSSEMCLSKSM